MTVSIRFFTDGKWELKYLYGSRRQIFQIGDFLKFIYVSPTEADLAVFKELGLGTEIFASRIRCNFANGVLTADGYGRDMTFTQNATYPTKLVYGANYQLGSVRQPDEGGDGDPK